MKKLSEKTIHSPCDEIYYRMHGNSTVQCRGVTTWNLENEFTVQPILMPFDPDSDDDSAAITFTCTTPRCYSSANRTASGLTIYGQDACNVVFNAWRTGNDTVETPIPLHYILNNTTIGQFYLSPVSTHGATQAYELANVNVSRGSTIYRDMERNTLVFQNNSNSTIQLDHVKIIRTYKMCNPTADYPGSCTFSADGPCYEGTATGTSGGFDATRIDTPCFCDGGGLSATHWQDKGKEGHTIFPGSVLSWTFNFGELPAYAQRNYVGKSICLFNFNNVQALASIDGDVALDLVLNGYTINTFYLSGKMGDDLLPLAPSHDLAKQGINYHDTMPNTVSLVNTSTVNVQMGSGNGGVDVFRIYETNPVYCCGECEVSCETCQIICESMCQTGCEVSCQTGCEVSCQTGCEVSCQTGCEVSCQSCEVCVTCQTRETCPLGYYTCQGCETCQPCYSCQTACQLACQNCQTGCEVSCQDCQVCVTCQTRETCPIGYYTCQECETCQPGYT